MFGLLSQASHQNLKRKAEQLDMEVMESRMMRSSFMDGDISTEEEEGKVTIHEILNTIPKYPTTAASAKL